MSKEWYSSQSTVATQLNHSHRIMNHLLWDLPFAVCSLGGIFMIIDNHDQNFLHNHSLSCCKRSYPPTQTKMSLTRVRYLVNRVLAVGIRLSEQETLLGMLNFCRRYPCQEQDDPPSMDEIGAAKQCSTAFFKLRSWRKNHINFEDGHFHRLVSNGEKCYITVTTGNRCFYCH